jgi:hypothetical protein
VNWILIEAVTNRLSKRFLDDSAFQDLVVDRVRVVQMEHEKREVLRQMHFLRSVDMNRREIQIRLPQYIEIPSGKLLRNRALEEYAVRWNLLRVIVDIQQLAEAVRRDLEYMAPRLIGKEDEIHGEYDRLMAEGTFRTGMFLPMCYLFIVLAQVTNPWWLLGLTLPVALLYLGAHSRGLARQQLASAILAERIESPVLERIANAPYVPFAQYDEVVVAIRRATPSGPGLGWRR